MTFPGSVSLLIRQPPVSQEPRSARFRKVRNFRTPLCPIRPHLQFFSLHPNANVGQQVMFFDERRLPQISDATTSSWFKPEARSAPVLDAARTLAGGRGGGARGGRNRRLRLLPRNSPPAVRLQDARSVNRKIGVLSEHRLRIFWQKCENFLEKQFGS